MSIDGRLRSVPIAALRCSARHPRISTAQSQRKRPRIGAIEARIGRATALPCCRIAVKASLRLPAIDEIRAHEAELIAIRRRIHANPELAHEERSTADLVAERLAPWGYPVHRGLGATVDIDYQRGYPMEINDPRQTAFARQVALDGLGEEGSIPDPEPVTGSEDFAFFLEKVPGGYFS